MTLPLPSPRIVKPDGSADAAGVQRNFEALAQTFPVNAPNSAYPVVTALPTGASISNGQVIYYLADSTNGVVWQLKYRSASASAFKWEYVGGPPLISVVDTQEGTASATFVALATAQSVTCPLAGDYDVRLDAFAFNSTALGAAVMSFDVGGTGAVDADGINFNPAIANTDAGSVSRMRRKTGIAAATALTVKHRTTAGTGQFSRRLIAITPVRVG